jgi:hypothetical protein
MGHFFDTRFQPSKQPMYNFWSLVSMYNFDDISNIEKYRKMEIKATLWVLADIFGVSGLLFAAINFNLSFFEQLITWLILSALGIFRLLIIRENWLSKKYDNVSKKIDSQNKKDKYEETHKPQLKKVK